MHSAGFLLLSGGGPDPLVVDIAICLVVSAVLCVLFERLHVPVVAAFVTGGVLAGPMGLQLVTNTSNISTIASLGLTLLLFLIGLELNVRALLRSGRTLLATGALQVPLTVLAGIAIFLGLKALGFRALAGSYAPLYLGLACGFSSTLLVVKLLQERFRMDSQAGRLCVGLLIFQDIWAIVVLAIQPNFARPNLSAITGTLFGVVLIAGLATLFARYILPTAFRLVAKVPELVVTTALGWCFGIGLLGTSLGRLSHGLGVDFDPSISMEMGALIAGTSIASFPYAYDVIGKVVHLRDFFVTLFFVALGMGLLIPKGIEIVALTLLLATVAVLLRYIVFLPLLYALGLDRRASVETSTKLAQISEFCLVIAYLGHGFGHIDEDLVSVIVFAFVATSLVTPALFTLSDRLDGILGGFLSRLGMKQSETQASHSERHGGRIAILGFHHIGSALLYDLGRKHPELLAETIVVDFNVALHDRIRATGARPTYGDLASPETLRHAGIAEAEVIVSTVPDDLLKGTNNQKIVRAARALNPKAHIIAQAPGPSEVDALYQAGADYVFLWWVDVSLSLLPTLYASLNGDLDALLEARRRERGRLSERREALE
jgi:Kef-type K+ transport system membrane component KefB